MSIPHDVENIAYYSLGVNDLLPNGYTYFISISHYPEEGWRQHSLLSTRHKMRKFHKLRHNNDLDIIIDYDTAMIFTKTAQFI